jgi:hypothetical protein
MGALPPGSPHGASLKRERRSPSKAFPDMSESPVKIPPPLQGPLTKPLHREGCSISRAFFYILYKSPAKELPSRFPSRSSHRKRRSVSRAFFYLSLKVPSEPPLQGPPTVPSWREMPATRAFLYISFKVPSKGAPLHVPLSAPPHEPHAERRSVSGAFFYLSLKVPGEEVPPPSSFNGALLERDARHQSLLLHILPSPQ